MDESDLLNRVCKVLSADVYVQFFHTTGYAADIEGLTREFKMKTFDDGFRTEYR